MAVSPDIAKRAHSRIGTLLNDKWRLESVLGVGGMATVFGAVHRNQNRVAIKMLHPEVSVDEGIRSRFLREGYVANTVGHAGAVTVFDDDIAEDGSAFLVMELLQGETLEEYSLSRGGSIPVATLLPLMEQLLDVLAAAHAKGVLHRDIKPENLFLTEAGQLKVLDFGIARVRQQEHSGSTAAGTFMGTPSFMAPEQAKGRWSDVDGRSDIWAVGATMYTLLTGRHVHEAESISEQLVLAVTRPAASILTLIPDLDSAVAAFVDRALAYERDQRFANIAEMRHELAKLLAHVSLPSGVRIQPTTLASRGVPSLTPVERVADTVAVSSGVDQVAAQTLANVVSSTPPAPISNVLPPWRRAWPWLLVGAMVAGLTALALTAGREPSAVPVPAASSNQVVEAEAPENDPLPSSPDPATPEPESAEPQPDAGGELEDGESPGNLAPFATPRPRPSPLSPAPAIRPAPGAPRPAPGTAPAPAPASGQDIFDQRY